MGLTVDKVIEKIDLNKEVKEKEIEELLSNLNVYEKYSLIKEMQKILKKKRTTFVYQKNLALKNNNDELIVIKEKISKVKKLEKMLSSELSLLVFPERESSSKGHIPTFLKMQISNLSDIRSMDYLLDEETKYLLARLETVSNTEKLEILEQLNSKFENLLNSLKEGLEIVVDALLKEVKLNGDYHFVIKKKNVKNVLSNDQYSDFKFKIDYYETSIKRVKGILERLYTLSGIQKAAISKEQRLEAQRNLDIFDDNTSSIVDMILCNTNLEEEVKKQLRNSAKYFLTYLDISKYDTHSWDEMMSSLNSLTDFFISTFDSIKSEDVVCLCNIFKNCLKRKNYELKDFEKKEQIDTSIQRKQLKKIMKRYEKTKDNIFESFVPVSNQAYYHIFTSFLNDELNYYYFKRILEEVKNELSEEQISSLLDTLLDRFIVNYKYKLANQKFSYIDPKYYESLMTLFIEHDLITDSQKEIIMNRLEEFVSYLCKKEGQISLPKSEALKEVEELSHKLIDGIEERKIENIQAKIKYTMEDKMGYIINHSNTLGFSDSTGDIYQNYLYSTFSLGKYAYSTRYNEEGDLLLQVHVLDTSSFITENDLVDDDVKNSLIQNDKLTYPFLFEKGNKYPVMTFQFRIYRNNTVGNMKLFSNVIQIDSNYNMDDLAHYRENQQLKSLISAYKRIGNQVELEDSFDMDRYTDKVLSNHIMNFLNGFEKEVPMLYKRASIQNMEEMNVKNHNQICYYLSKIDKKIAHKIYYILDEEPADIYTNYRMDDTYLNMDMFSYAGIYLLRTLKQLLKGEYAFHEEEYEVEKNNMIQYCKKVNEQFGYVPEKIMKQDKKKNIDKRYKSDKMNS